MATTRLRRAFRYPEDSDDEDYGRKELDEEEQERVIEQLQQRNNKQNAEYSLVFTTFPLFSAILFVPSLLSGSSTLTVRLLSSLGILSLAITAYIMRLSVLHTPDRKGKRPAAEVEHTLFVRKALLFGNSVICGLLVSVYLFTSSPSLAIWPALFLIPGAMLVIILVSMRAMISVDLSRLENLRYQYKGA